MPPTGGRPPSNGRPLGSTLKSPGFQPGLTMMLGCFFRNVRSGSGGVDGADGSGDDPYPLNVGAFDGGACCDISGAVPKLGTFDGTAPAAEGNMRASTLF